MATEQTAVAVKRSGLECLGEPIGADQLLAAANAALSMVTTIRRYLPIKGEPKQKWHTLVIDGWFEAAGRDYTTFERIRNPKKQTWPGPRGRFYVEAPTRDAPLAFETLCCAMERVVETYQWQGVSDETQQRFHSSSRDGSKPIPTIERVEIDAVENAANGLLEELDVSNQPSREQQPPNDGPFGVGEFQFKGQKAKGLTLEEVKFLELVVASPPTWTEAWIHLWPGNVNVQLKVRRDEFDQFKYRLNVKLKAQGWRDRVYSDGRAVAKPGRHSLRPPKKTKPKQAPKQAKTRAR